MVILRERLAAPLRRQERLVRDARLAAGRERCRMFIRAALHGRHAAQEGWKPERAGPGCARRAQAGRGGLCTDTVPMRLAVDVFSPLLFSFEMPCPAERRASLYL